MANYGDGARGTCPHCGVLVLFERVFVIDEEEGDGPEFAQSNRFVINSQEPIRTRLGKCPACDRIVISVQRVRPQGGNLPFRAIGPEILCWPRVASRNPVPSDVPKSIAADYEEAALVVSLSPKASAALSRRCLQSVLREQGYHQKDLAQQIDAVLPNLPTHIRKIVDAVRNFGNFAAHPITDKNAGVVIDVEPGEAEWTLDVLDSLFDFFYVQPAEHQRRLDALNSKLKAAGKPPVK